MPTAEWLHVVVRGGPGHARLGDPFGWSCQIRRFGDDILIECLSGSGFDTPARRWLQEFCRRHGARRVLARHGDRDGALHLREWKMSNEGETKYTHKLSSERVNERTGEVSRITVEIPGLSAKRFAEGEDVLIGAMRSLRSGH